MSLESLPYYSIPDRDAPRRKIDLDSAFKVRPHHWDSPGFDVRGTYVDLLQNYTKYGGNTDLASYCSVYADASILAAWDNTQPDFRVRHGRSADDDTVPNDYPPDVVGDTPQEQMQYYRAFGSELRTFASAPPDRLAVVGPYIDGICGSCIFGGGNGGLHCQTYNASLEEISAQKLRSEARNYISNSLNRSRRDTAPETFWMQRDFVEVPDTFRVVSPTKNGTVTRLVMPLGLLRDITTFRATRMLPNGDTFSTLNDLVNFKERRIMPS